MSRIISSIFATTGFIIGWMYGELNTMFYALLALMLLDYISGVLQAIHNKKLSSTNGYKGITKKIAILLLVSVGHIVDTYILHDGSAIKSTIMLFYASNEAISILENVGGLGLPLPKTVISILAQISKK